MSKKAYFLIYVVSLVFFAIISFMQKTPGYMDAAYYYSSGVQLASGRGFTEPFVWNYLANPVSVPVLAFTYWMPLAGLLSALGLFIFHTTAYWAARIPFVLLSSLIPLLAVLSARRFTTKRYLYIFSGILGLVGGYYLPYYTITETFVPYLVLGGIYFLLANQLLNHSNLGKRSSFYVVLLGITAGLMHLTRADGILWLAGCWLVILMMPLETGKNWTSKLVSAVICLLGYLAIMSPWYLRNLLQFHSLFPAGSNLALYFTNYNDLFAYPNNQLKLSHLISSGLSNIAMARMNAGIANLSDLLGAVGGIILFPFMVAGLWINRRNKLIQFSLIMLTGVFLVMTLLFPFAGQRGGFFHSASAFQCLLWGVTPIGFEFLIIKLATIRNWKAERSIRLLGNTALSVFALLSVVIFINKLIGNGSEIHPGWDQKYEQFAAVNVYLLDHGVKPGDIIMVNDSPGFYTMTGHETIQMTSGTLNDAYYAMQKFGAHYVLIDEGHTSAFDQLYLLSESTEHFLFVGKFENFVVYKTNG